MQIDFNFEETMNQIEANIISEIKEYIDQKIQCQNRWLKSSEVKKLLGISDNTLRDGRRKGIYPCTNLDGDNTYYYDRLAIEKNLEKNLNTNKYQQLD